MTAFVVRRLIGAVIIVFLVSVVAFFFMQLIPGDPAVALAGPEASAEEVEGIRHEFWLDRPLYVQYGHWVDGLLHGKLGTSIRSHQDVSNLIVRKAPISLFLAGSGILLGAIVGITAGILSAMRRGSFLDSVITLFANLGISIPVYWLGILLIYLVGLKLGLLPICGYTSPLEDFWLSIRKFIMPIVSLSFYPMAFLTRQTRSSMLEVIHEDYIRTAWAKGLREREVIVIHALKNAFIPIISVLGLLVARLIGGAVLVETVFNIPGMGRLIVDGVMDLDFVVVQGCIVVVAVLVVFINLLVDISYGWFNPRIKYQ